MLWKSFILSKFYSFTNRCTIKMHGMNVNKRSFVCVQDSHCKVDVWSLEHKCNYLWVVIKGNWVSLFVPSVKEFWQWRQSYLFSLRLWLQCRQFLHTVWWMRNGSTSRYVDWSLQLNCLSKLCGYK